ncbi:outer membrane beta-barrel protein [Thalassotalea mangrovi]|nr:outer membrane beta-barrel protein [Thalassotalea mangrovi]
MNNKGYILVWFSLLFCPVVAHALPDENFEQWQISLTSAPTGETVISDSLLDNYFEPVNPMNGILAWDTKNHHKGEIFLSQSMSDNSSAASFLNSDIQTSFVHIGGNLRLNNGRVPLYLLGGLGVSHIDTNSDELGSSTHPSANVGLAAEFPVNKAINLKFETRVIATFYEGNDEMFCDTGECAINGSSNFWYQADVSAGVVFKF